MRHGRMTVLGSILVALVSPIAFGQAPTETNGTHYVFVDGFRMARLDGIGRVYRIDLLSISAKVIWEDKWDVRQVLVQPSGECVAVHAQSPGRRVWKVVLLDFDGKELRILEGIHGGVAWSPDGRYLAYTSGSELDAESSRVTGLWLYDTRSMECRRVPCEGITLGEGARLAWPSFDNRLYLWLDWEGPAVSYQLQERRFVSSPYGSIRFSPNGKYYVVGCDGTEPALLHLYSRGENQDVSARIAILNRRDLHKGVKGWASDHHLCLQKREPPTEEFLVDCNNGSVLDIPGRAVALTDGNSSVIIARDHGVLNKIDMASLEPFLVPSSEEKSDK